MSKNEIYLDGADKTKALGETLANLVRDKGLIVALVGQLGAGKTTFVQGFCSALQVKEAVSSPTFLMLNEYTADAALMLHFDLYRLQEDLDSDSITARNLKAEFDEVLSVPGRVSFVFVEWLNLWPEFLSGYDYLNLKLIYSGAGRKAILEANGDSLRQLLDALADKYQ